MPQPCLERFRLKCDSRNPNREAGGLGVSIPGLGRLALGCLGVILVLGLSVPLSADEADEEVSTLCASGLSLLLKENPEEAASTARELLSGPSAPPVCLLVLAHAQLALHRPVWALGSLKRWSSLGGASSDGRAEVWYRRLLCEALFATRQYGSAARACSDPALSDSWGASYVQGVSLFYEDQLPQAAHALSSPQLRWAPQDIRRSARDFRNLAMLGVWGLSPGLQGAVDLAGGVDTNPYFSQEDYAADSAGLRMTVPFYRLGAQLEWTSRPFGRNWLTLSGTALGNAYPGGRATDVSSLVLASQLELTRLFLLGRRVGAVGVTLGADAVMLQGGPRLPEAEPYVFRSDLFLGVSAALLVSSRFRAGLEAETSKARFRELVRNGWAHTLRLPVALTLSDRWWVSGALRGTFHQSGTAYRRWELGANVSVQWNFLSRWSSWTGVGADSASYPESAGYFGGDTDRQDLVGSWRFGVSFRPLPSLVLLAEGELRYRSSTSPGMDFERFLASGGLRWEF